MFSTAFQATMGVLVAILVWSIVTGAITVIAVRLIEK